MFFPGFPMGCHPWVSTSFHVSTLSQVLTALDEAISITKEDQAERFLKAWFQRKRWMSCTSKWICLRDIDMFWEQEIDI